MDTPAGYTPTKVDVNSLDLNSLDPKVLENLNFEDLRTLRNRAGDNQELQNLLAPYEHQVYARDYTEENPLGAVAMMMGIPAYAGAKAIGLMKGRSDNLSGQMLAGYKGVGQGMMNRVGNILRGFE